MSGIDRLLRLSPVLSAFGVEPQDSLGTAICEEARSVFRNVGGRPLTEGEGPKKMHLLGFIEAASEGAAIETSKLP